jgi:hypothetical protein
LCVEFRNLAKHLKSKQMKKEHGYLFRMEGNETGPKVARKIGYSSSQEGNQEQTYSNNMEQYEFIKAVIERIVVEREQILSNNKLSTRKKLKLLENNRKTMILMSGGKISENENLVYSILIFSGFIIIVLAILNVVAKLPYEITLTFMGTVIGGTIATIAQKIEKINSAQN